MKDLTKYPHQRSRALWNLRQLGITIAEIKECMNGTS
jgi:hypothetical protein